MALTYRICPKCGHERAPDETATDESCPACGLIFAKYLQARAQSSTFRRAHTKPDENGDDDEDALPLAARVKALLFHIPDPVEPLYVYARGALLVVLLLYGIRLAA